MAASQTIVSVRNTDESESGQMVLEKVKRTYSEAHLWHVKSHQLLQMTDLTLIVIKGLHIYS